MSRPDEGLIHTWLDGECTPEESARIEALVASDPAWAAAVAEARGLVAASSRILGALDAVPARVLPEGSRARPAARPPAMRVRPWMGIAAGLMLAAGTAVVLRERAGEAFAPSASVDGIAPSAAPALSTETDRAEDTPAAAAQAIAPVPSTPMDIPTIGPARVTGGGAGVGGASVGGASDASRAMEAGRLAEIARAEETARVQSQEAIRAREQESRRVMAPQAAPPPAPPSVAARAPVALEAAKAMAPTVLAGCWRISAPPELVGLLRDPIIVRAAGDTLVLQLAVTREVTVVRVDNRLRGALDAVREPCQPAPMPESLPEGAH